MVDRHSVATATAAVVALGSIAAILVAFGVHPAEVGLYWAYFIGYVLIPGVALMLLLDPAPRGPLRLVAAGAGVGYVLETVCYAATAALGHRTLFVGYPAVVVVIAALGLGFRRRARPASVEPTRGGRGHWAVAAVAVGAVVLLAGQYFSAMPLPRNLSSGGAAYYGDPIYFVSIAGEAKHHWPLTEPTVSGTPLRYHTFSLLDMAAASSVTGIDLSTLAFRLTFATLIAIFVLQLVWVIRERGAGLRFGALVAAYVLLVGEIDLSPRFDHPFDDIFFLLLWFGPGIGSLIVFMPILVFAGEQFERRAKLRPGVWALLGLLLVGAIGTKGGSLLPVLGAAGAAFFVWTSLRERRPHLRSLAFVAATGLAFVAAEAFVYHGATRNLSWAPFHTLEYMRAVQVAASIFDWVQSPTWAVIAVVAGLIGLFGSSVLGFLLFYRARKLPHPPSAWLVCIAGSGLIPLILFTHPTLSHLHSLAYARVGAGVIAAEGLAAYARRADVRAAARRVWRAAAGAAAVLVVVSLYPLWHPLSDERLFKLQYGAVGALALAIAAAAWLRRSWLGAAAVGVLMLGAAVLNTPLESVAGPAKLALDGNLTYAQTDIQLTSGLYRGLVWIRDNTPSSAVLAVNNQGTAADGSGPFDFYYSAFSERRVFLEGWSNAERSLELGYDLVAEGQIQPFPNRLTLNKAVFESGSERALRRMASRYGVRYLVVDAQAGRASAPLRRIAVLVFSNPGVQVLRVPQRDLPVVSR